MFTGLALDQHSGLSRGEMNEGVLQQQAAGSCAFTVKATALRTTHTPLAHHLR